MKVIFVDPGKKQPSSMKKLLYSPHADLNLKNGETYIVYGISLWKDVLHYLIIPHELNVPDWLPADLFIIQDSKIPDDWYFCYFGENDSSLLKILIGYTEMITDVTHYINLIERDINALRTFYKRKYEIDELYK